MKYEFIVPDMTCGHCVNTLKESILSVAPQATVTGDPATHWLSIDNVDDAPELMMAMQQAGYSPRRV